MDLSTPDTHVQDQVLDDLVEQEVVSREGLQRARQQAATDRAHPEVTYHLVALGILEPVTLIKALAKRFGYKGFDVRELELTDELRRTISDETIRENLVLPVKVTGEKLYLAMSDPTDIATIDDLHWETGYDIEPLVADLHSLDQFIARRFEDPGEELDKVMRDVSASLEEDVEVIEEGDVTDLAVEEEVDSAPIVKLIHSVISEAIKRGASDIHFEFFENTAQVRFRIDGSLIPILSPPVQYSGSIVSRLKIMSGMNIGERRLPQDGRTRLKLGNRIVDFRVSTTPTNFGEKVVLRVLDKDSITLDIDALGIRGRDKDSILETIAHPYGMMLVTGPTGSGKTTTLYSVLSRLNTPDVNIMTVEDPIEYDFPGINQLAVRPEIDLTFARALRSFLRQDPDIVMVGEIRDQETSEIAIRAALTGHLVLSTIHTNDAPSTITRLLEMDIERFNIASALTTVVAQRLVRRICSDCQEPVQYSDEQIRMAQIPVEEARRITFYRGAGCDHCNNTGYRGRVGLYEVFRVTPEIHAMVIQGATAAEIKSRAVRGGMKTLRMAGIERIRDGVTTLEEVIKNTSAH